MKGAVCVARINIEDDIESQKEFGRLARMLDGDLDLALGKLVRFFRAAQDHYCDGTPMTAEELGLDGLSCMIESGWALPTEDGCFQVRNPEKHFDWIRQKKEAARAGGLARSNSPRDSSGKFQSETSRNPAGHQPDAGINPAGHQPASSPPTPPPPPIHKNKSSGDAVALALLWNENCGSLRKVRSPEKLDTKRTKLAAAAFKANPDLDLMRNVILRMARSEWCQGKKNSGDHKNWKAHFGFFVTPGVIDRALEGEFGCDPFDAPTLVPNLNSRDIELERMIAAGKLSADGSILEASNE
jgi:hypothetical protein